VISAKRPVVDVNQTSTISSVSRKEIEQLPVQQLSDLVALQAGRLRGFRAARSWRPK
jgi:hypothetical protein